MRNAQKQLCPRCCPWAPAEAVDDRRTGGSAEKSLRCKVRTCRHPQCPSRTASGGEEALLQERANYDGMDRGYKLPYSALGHHQGKVWRIGL